MPAPLPPSYPRLPRVSRREQHPSPGLPSVAIPAPHSATPAPPPPSCLRHSLHHSAPFSRHSRPRAGICPDSPPTPAPRSVAPDLIWGPYGGGRRYSAPSSSANSVGRTTRSPLLRTALGMGPRSSLGRRIQGTGVLGGVLEEVEDARGDSRSGAGMTGKWGAGMAERGRQGGGRVSAGCDGGAVRGEIPAASAGMTEVRARVWRRWG